MENNVLASNIANVREIDFSNRLEEILRQDTFKLLFNITCNIFENYKIKSYYEFLQSLSFSALTETIRKRKHFVLFEQLLVLRNVAINRETNLKLVLKNYFYKWKRVWKINPRFSFDKKLKLRKIITNRLKKADYFERLVKAAFFYLLRCYDKFALDLHIPTRSDYSSLHIYNSCGNINKNQVYSINNFYNSNNEKFKSANNPDQIRITVENKIINVNSILSNVINKNKMHFYFHF